MLFGEWDFEREKEVAREEVRQEVAQHYEAKLQTVPAQLRDSKALIQALQEENRRLREGR